jgi:hypothetical protein
MESSSLSDFIFSSEPGPSSSQGTEEYSNLSFTSTLQSDSFTSYRKSPNYPAVHEPLVIKKGRGHKFVQWSQDYKDEFMSWWLQTTAGKYALTNNTKIITAWDIGRKQSEVWKHFSLCAVLPSGDYHVVCNSCYTFFSHAPGGATSSLKRHFLNEHKGKRHNGHKQQSVATLLSNQWVSKV